VILWDEMLWLQNEITHFCQEAARNTPYTNEAHFTGSQIARAVG
jgi:hypothetical protein